MLASLPVSKRQKALQSSFVKRKLANSSAKTLFVSSEKSRKPSANKTIAISAAIHELAISFFVLQNFSAANFSKQSLLCSQSTHFN